MNLIENETPCKWQMTCKKIQININEDSSEGRDAPGRHRLLVLSEWRVVPSCPIVLPGSPSMTLLVWDPDSKAVLASFLFQPPKGASMAHWSPKSSLSKSPPLLSLLHGPWGWSVALSVGHFGIRTRGHGGWSYGTSWPTFPHFPFTPCFHLFSSSLLLQTHCFHFFIF